MGFLILANVVFPAPSFAYLVSLFLPFAAILVLATELGVFIAFQRGTKVPVLAGLVISANLFSWMAGTLLCDLFFDRLPSGLVTVGSPGNEHLTRGPDFNAIADWSFAGACVLSYALELAFIHLAARLFRIQLKKLPACVGVANVASYTVLFLLVLLFRRS